MPLQKLSTLQAPQVEQLAEKLHVHSSQKSRFTRAVSVIPNLAVKVEEARALSLTVLLNRLNPIVEREGRVYAPRYPKPQTEGWFIVICDVAKDEILGVKRVTFRRKIRCRSKS